MGFSWTFSTKDIQDVQTWTQTATGTSQQTLGTNSYVPGGVIWTTTTQTIQPLAAPAMSVELLMMVVAQLPKEEQGRLLTMLLSQLEWID